MSKELLEKKHDLITRAETLLASAKTENRELTEDEAAELAEIRDNVRRIVEALDIEKDLRDMKGDKTEEDKGGEPAKEETPEERAVAESEERAFDAYIRGIVLNTRDGELTKAANGAVIPQTILNRIIKKVYEICPILEQSSKYNVKGNLNIPYYGEDSTNFVNVAYQDEFAELESNVGSFTSIQLTGYLAGALVLVSRSLLNNSQFDLTAFVVNHMAYAIKRFIEGELLNGTNGKVEGLSGLETSVTAGAADVITADEVIKLHDSIIDEFQDGAIWIMSRNTRTALRLLKDGMDRYMLQDDISLPFGTSLLGKPVYVSDNMPEMEAGKDAIYYGNLSGLATKFSEEMNIQVLREKFATRHAVGVVGWLEFDSKVENAQKLAKLTMAA